MKEIESDLTFLILLFILRSMFWQQSVCFIFDSIFCFELSRPRPSNLNFSFSKFLLSVVVVILFHPYISFYLFWFSWPSRSLKISVLLIFYTLFFFNKIGEMQCTIRASSTVFSQIKTFYFWLKWFFFVKLLRVKVV